MRTRTALQPGRYDVTVGPNNCTYLSDGQYDVTVDRRFAYFHNVARGSGTFEDIRMLHIYQRQGRLTLKPAGQAGQ